MLHKTFDNRVLGSNQADDKYLFSTYDTYANIAGLRWLGKGDVRFIIPAVMVGWLNCFIFEICRKAGRLVMFRSLRWERKGVEGREGRRGDGRGGEGMGGEGGEEKEERRGEWRGREERGGRKGEEDYRKAVCQINNWSHYTDPSVGRAYGLEFTI